MQEQAFFDPKAIPISCKLATEIGLNEAIFLGQLEICASKSTVKIDGNVWVENTIKNWHKLLPFFSEKTIIRIISKLEDLGYISTTNKLNYSPFDQTKWYSIRS